MANVFIRSLKKEMIDIHSHILPNLDDGAKDLDASISMLREAEAQGIETVFATPHILTGLYEPSVKEIRNAAKSLKERIKLEKININIVVGAEIGITSEVKESEIMNYTLNGNTKYILLELPFVSYPLNCDEKIFHYCSLGFYPIIAHPERAFSIMKNPDKLKEWKRRGILIQINSKSILGRYGRIVRNIAIKMLKDGIVDFVASDAHNAKWGFDFEDAKPLLEKIVGKPKTKELLGQTARRLLLSEMLNI